MGDRDLDVKLAGEVLGKMLGAVDRTVLSTGTSEADLKMGELPLYEAFDMGIDQLVDAVEEGEDLAVVLEEADDRLIEARELFVLLIASGVVRAAAVEHIPAPVA